MKHLFLSEESIIWQGAVALRQAAPLLRGAVP